MDKHQTRMNYVKKFVRRSVVGHIVFADLNVWSRCLPGPGKVNVSCQNPSGATNPFCHL